jgi:hypothetical protein
LVNLLDPKRFKHAAGVRDAGHDEKRRAKACCMPVAGWSRTINQQGDWNDAWHE